MNLFSPLYLNSILSQSQPAHPDDTIIAARSLNRLGHYQPAGDVYSDRPDGGLFDAIKSFQRQDGLRSDGWMQPDGETATEIGRQLFFDTPIVPVSQIPPHVTQRCDHLYWNVDIPACRALSARRGKRAALLCFAAASARYAACIKGARVDDLPPLHGWTE